MAFHSTRCSFTTCLYSRRQLTVLFVCHRTVSMTAVYQVKIKYDQDKFGAIFLDAFDTIKRAVSFSLEDKDVVNENHVIRKSHDATFVPRDWLESNSWHQKCFSEGGKKIRRCHGLLGRVISMFKFVFINQSTFSMVK